MAQQISYQEDSAMQPQMGPSDEASRRSASSKKITHRSQSSPSSLITQKFGLRPTPSPPRLIIDHQTGDIIESYPSSYNNNSNNNNNNTSAYQHPQQTYRNTNKQQPTTALIEEELSANAAAHHNGHTPITIDYQSLLDTLPPQTQTTTTDLTSAQQQYNPYDSPLNHQFDVDGLLLQHHQQQQQQFDPSAYNDNNNLSRSQSPNLNNNNNSYSGDENDDGETRRRHRRSSDRKRLATSSKNNSISDRLHPLLTRQQQSQLSETDNTIAIVTSPSPSPDGDRNNLNHHHQFMNINEGYSDDDRTTIMTTPNKIHAKMARSATTSMMRRHQMNSMGRFGPSAQHHQLNLTPEQRLQRARQRSPSPNIEDFKLYDIWYNLRILLILLISILAIYLVFTYLIEDCILYRPTHSYISVFISSLNIICVLMFTIFWYSTSVTRTLYSNLSSSAFIISIYSILTVVNLSIAIVLFLINSCHFQKLINTQSSAALLASQASSSQQQAPDSLIINEPFAPTELDQYGANKPLALRLETGSKDSSSELILDKLNLGEAREEKNLFTHHLNKRHLLTSDNIEHAIIGDTVNQPVRPPLISPWEAAWDYIRDNLNDFKRAFYRFLMKYDLKFIGALHAINSMCLQYCAMRVAVIRSHFCSPIPVYI